MTRPYRILLVTPVSPYSVASGAEQRSKLLLQALQTLGTTDVLQLQHGQHTEVSSIKESGQPKILVTLHRADLTLRRYEPKLDLTQRIESALGNPIAHYDLVVGRYLWSVCQLRIPQHVPVIVDLDDFKCRYAPGQSWTWQLAKERLSKALAYRLMQKQLNRFQGAFVVSHQDQHELSQLPNVLLPNVALTTCAEPTPVPTSKNVLFVGSLWYRPNADAVQWLLKRVWPLVLAVEPQATLTLVGSASLATRTQWASHPRVSAPGFATDLATCYQDASLVVAPIQSGGGTNIKVLEAMAHGRPCLVSRFVAESFNERFVDGQHWLVAENEREFAAQICEVLSNQRASEKIAKAGYLAVRQTATADAFTSIAVPFIRACLQKHQHMPNP